MNYTILIIAILIVLGIITFGIIFILTRNNFLSSRLRNILGVDDYYTNYHKKKHKEDVKKMLDNFLKTNRIYALNKCTEHDNILLAINNNNPKNVVSGSKQIYNMDGIKFINNVSDWSTVILIKSTELIITLQKNTSIEIIPQVNKSFKFKKLHIKGPLNCVTFKILDLIPTLPAKRTEALVRFKKM